MIKLKYLVSECAVQPQACFGAKTFLLMTKGRYIFCLLNCALSNAHEKGLFPAKWDRLKKIVQVIYPEVIHRQSTQNRL